MASMAPGCGDASMGTRLHRTGDDLSKLLAELRASESIHFHKALARRSQLQKFNQCEKLTIPSWFVEKHGDKFEQWTILRTLSSPKPWRVHLKITRAPYAQVSFRGEWTKFAAENHLKEGDSLVFVLNVDARSEFQVHIFRGVSCVQETGGFTAATTSSESKSLGEVPPQHGTNCDPSFRRRITANHEKNRMEIPAHFVRAHRMQLRGESVKVQGVHQESHVQVVELYRNDTVFCKQERLYFQAGWREFVNANGLQEGQELQFKLMAASSFTVRVV